MYRKTHVPINVESHNDKRKPERKIRKDDDVVVVVVCPHLPDLWEVSAHSTEVTGSTVFCSHQDLGVMVSSFRTRRQCLSFSGRGKPSQGQRSTSGVESPDGGKGWKAFVELISS